jgi:hypothetical protein
MLNPPHPGLSVKHDCIEALGLTVTRAAEILGVTRQTLNDLVHCRRGGGLAREIGDVSMAGMDYLLPVHQRRARQTLCCFCFLSL